jgi:hypothetical protein
VLSIIEKEPRVDADSSAASGKEVRITVTGLDEKGQMFRETAPIVEIDGRTCQFCSKFKPELGSWVLVEFDLSKSPGAKRTTVQGQVKSASPETSAANMYRIQVELETAQDLKISAPSEPVKAAAPLSQPAPAIVPAPAAKVEAPRAQKEITPAPVTRLKPEVSAELPAPLESQPGKSPAPAIREAVAPKPSPAAPPLDREILQTAVAQEIKQQLAALKGPLAEELERNTQRTVAAGLEPVVRQSIEKQIAGNFQSAVQTLNSDLTYQLAGHLAGSEELRGSIEKLAKKAVEEQTEQAQKSLAGGLNALEAVRTLEKTVAEMESRLNAARGEATATLERLQAADREIADSAGRLQKVVDQMNQAARSTIEKFDAHITSQLNSWSGQFKNHIDGVSQEKAAQFNSGLEHQLSLQMQEANEVLEKLSAGLQLARGTIRAQESQLAERTQSVAAEFEKEIRSVLMRLAGGL